MRSNTVWYFEFNPFSTPFLNLMYNLISTKI